MKTVLPGFKRSILITLAWLGSMVLLPLTLLVLTAWQLKWADIVQIITSERVISSLTLSFEMAAIATLINIVFGFLLAWVLVRYNFPGKNLVNALVDLPFSLPTAVAGIALTSLYWSDWAMVKPFRDSTRLYSKWYCDCADFCQLAFYR